MNSRPTPPDQQQRMDALDATRSILVRAPAGSGKTDLLTRRYFRLLAEVESPGQIVAITFTNAAAAEMRHRILSELEKAAVRGGDQLPSDEFSMEALAARALMQARRLGWNLLHAPAQLRISTIDSFCRELALQQPMFSGLGGGLEVHEQPDELYRHAARRTLERLGQQEAGELSQAIERLLLWRDNDWQELEKLLVTMLSNRDRWMQGFVMGRAFDENEEELRDRLERPFAQAVRTGLTELAEELSRVPGAMEEILTLARYACEQSDGRCSGDLAELAELPCPPFASNGELEAAQTAFLAVADFLLTGTGTLRKTVNKSNGFPADRKQEIERFKALTGHLRGVEGFEELLTGVRALPPVRYSEAEWAIVRACFTLLRRAAAELRVAFAESGAVDFVEIAQIAELTLTGPDGLPTDAAMAVADGIRHLLVDEFQDTSRRQHKLLAGLVAAWPEREGRTCFVVGDPMQSIYFFRDADAELFPRVERLGLELPDGEPLTFTYTPLQANFRTAPELVERLNALFPPVFAVRDGSGIAFAAATPARPATFAATAHFQLHLDFEPYAAPNRASEAAGERQLAREAQIAQVVALIEQRLTQARTRQERCRIAILGRARRDLAPIALALRDASIPFRAVDLEDLADRPEILDALALARALANPLDRIAWLGVLRAPWCGLSLTALHALTGGDDAEAIARPIAELAAERLTQLTGDEYLAAARTLAALEAGHAARSALPAKSLGSWLAGVWTTLGGPLCTDATAQANLDLLWSTLDRLPNGELDLGGPALDAAIAKLRALPDPAADPECGVQLMTIHKSKGLEFEIVIVPELQSPSPRSGYRMLSWLERGVPASGEGEEITEFLIAPLQSKGTERGTAKGWVDRVYRDRERQEMRRILYVAATRARDELHLFARCAWRQAGEAAAQLVTPSESLLGCAWPALQEEVQARFAAWAAQQQAARQEAELESLAASADNLVVMPAPRSSSLRRLPPSAWPQSQTNADSPDSAGLDLRSARGAEPLYARHEGGTASRALGVAVHTLLEELTRLRTRHEWPEAIAALATWEARVAAQIRAHGIDFQRASALADEAMRLAENAAQQPIGQWLLSPRIDAQSEAAWCGVINGAVRTVRVDRIFRAGNSPHAEANSTWWIVDYKTAHAAEAEPAVALARLRPLFAAQLTAYAEILRQLHGAATQVRAGLYYPRMKLFDWWEC